MTDTIIGATDSAHLPVSALTNNDLGTLIVNLLKGVIYRENDAQTWSALIRLQPRLRDFVGVMGLELTVDDAEGYAFLRSRPLAEDGDTVQLLVPRLMTRRPLSFPVSLLLALLRKKLAEFDASGAETRLILSRREIVELIRVFLPDSNNEAQLVNKIDAHINKIVEFGFLRKLKAETLREDTFEVRRILKAFVDAQWLSDFNERLEQYRSRLGSTDVDD